MPNILLGMNTCRATYATFGICEGTRRVLRILRDQGLGLCWRKLNLRVGEILPARCKSKIAVAVFGVLHTSFGVSVVNNATFRVSTHLIQDKFIPTVGITPRGFR